MERSSGRNAKRAPQTKFLQEASVNRDFLVEGEGV